MDKQYAASVAEFEKVTTKDPSGKLGIQALYRGAMTQSLFLSRFDDAIRKLKRFIELTDDPEAQWDAKVQIGEILYSKLEQYDAAATHYRALIQERPKSPLIAEFRFRVAKASFYLRQFDVALKEFAGITQSHPKTPWAEKASYELGFTVLTKSGQQTEERAGLSAAYQEAIDAFDHFIKKYPQSELVPLARFGIANCLEEMDQLEAALHSYEALKATYPSPNVIEIKLARIRERQAQRRR